MFYWLFIHSYTDVSMLVVMLSHRIVDQNNLAGPECAGHTTGTQPIPDNTPTNQTNAQVQVTVTHHGGKSKEYDLLKKYNNNVLNVVLQKDLQTSLEILMIYLHRTMILQ